MLLNELKQLVHTLLRDEAISKLEHSPVRYDLDVIDPSEYHSGRLTNAEERQRQARYAEYEALYEAEHTAEVAETETIIEAVIERLRRQYLRRARLKLRSMSYRVDYEVARELRKLVAEHKSSEDAILFAYLTMKSSIEWDLDTTPPVEITDDRSDPDEDVYDGPEQLGALIRELSLPEVRKTVRLRVA